MAAFHLTRIPAQFRHWCKASTQKSLTKGCPGTPGKLTLYSSLWKSRWRRPIIWKALVQKKLLSIEEEATLFQDHHIAQGDGNKPKYRVIQGYNFHCAQGLVLEMKPHSMFTNSGTGWPSMTYLPSNNLEIHIPYPSWFSLWGKWGILWAFWLCNSSFLAWTDLPKSNLLSWKHCSPPKRSNPSWKKMKNVLVSHAIPKSQHWSKDSSRKPKPPYPDPLQKYPFLLSTMLTVDSPLPFTLPVISLNDFEFSCHYLNFI